MFDTKGYFNKKGDEYTLTTPKSRAPYINCLVNNKGYCFSINQYGSGETLCKFKFTEKNTITNNNERTIFFRDDETNDVWCVGGFPFVSEIEDFKCIHKQSSTVISSVHNGIEVSVRSFVPLDRRCDIQTVTVNNLSGRERKISVFPTIKLLLSGYPAPPWCDSVEQSFVTDFKKEINGLYLDTRNPYTAGKPYNAYLHIVLMTEFYSDVSIRSAYLMHF